MSSVVSAAAAVGSGRRSRHEHVMFAYEECGSSYLNLKYLLGENV